MKTKDFWFTKDTEGKVNEPRKEGEKIFSISEMDKG